MDDVLRQLRGGMKEEQTTAKATAGPSTSQIPIKP
jgi:hypothetical protein